MDINIKNSIDNLSAPARHAIFAGLILVAAVFVYLNFLQPKDDQLTALTGKNNSLEQEVARGVAVETSYNKLQEELQNMNERLVSLEKILPREKEASSFLRSVQRMATDSSLKIDLFKPQEIVANANGYYSDWPVQLKVEGNYHGLGQFFEKISRAPRIINVPTLSIQNITDQTDTRRTIIATGMATTYVQGVAQPPTEQTEGRK